MEIVKQDKTIDVLKQQVGLQQQQAEAMLAVIERMDEQEKRVDIKIGRVEQLVEDVSKKVHLDEKESTDIQSIVNRQAWKFANIKFEESGFEEPYQTELFMSKLGHFRSVIYKRLKKQFNVTKYTHIPHEKFNEALSFVHNVSYDNLNEIEKRWTAKQRELLERGW